MNRGLLTKYFYSIMSDISFVQEKQEAWKKQILKEYEKTYDMPRKMKKRRRKELNLNWRIANYDPLKNLFN